MLYLSNIPPRDVMASGRPEQVTEAVLKAFSEIEDYGRIIWSVGGGLAPDVKDENIEAFIGAVKANKWR
jgi:uroporphyrinogen-III decarboxylase